MLTRTSELGIKTILYLALNESEQPIPPRRMADALRCSPSYLAKTANMLVKAGLLRALRGASGGLLLTRSPDEITLLDVVEACQGLVTANYCSEPAPGTPICGYHEAMAELHEAITSTLSRWTLRDLLTTPYRDSEVAGLACRMLIHR
jgi:Rrf2 family transcriptional regulator, nitric oxide-sensitive transcriptional repressor